MIQFIYYIFFWLVVFQSLIFCSINVSSPIGIRATMIRYINTNKYIRKFLRYHLWLCMVAAIFFYDSYRTEQIFHRERANINMMKEGQTAIEIRRGLISYTIMKVQRNQYITLMLIYTSVVLNIYLGMVHHMYTKREKYYRCDEKICDPNEPGHKKRVEVTPAVLSEGLK